MPSRIGYVIDHGGPQLAMRKMIRTLKRYGLNPEKMCQNVKTFSEILSRNDVEANLFIPASTIEKNEKHFRKIKFDNIEYGAHGYLHIDYSTLKKKEQTQHFERMVKIFKDNGIKDFGFRAPYGRLNDHTYTLLKKHGFKFDSSEVYYFKGIINENKEVRSVLKDYSLRKNPHPVENKGVLRIPFSLPDDEILVERSGLKESEIKRIWCKMVDEMEKRGNLLVLQFHPHRIRGLKRAINGTIRYALKNDIEVVTLSRLIEIFNKHPNRINSEKHMCVTGDIDALKISEFI